MTRHNVLVVSSGILANIERNLTKLQSKTFSVQPNTQQEIVFPLKQRIVDPTPMNKPANLMVPCAMISIINIGFEQHDKEGNMNGWQLENIQMTCGKYLECFWMKIW